MRATAQLLMLGILVCVGARVWGQGADPLGRKDKPSAKVELSHVHATHSVDLIKGTSESTLILQVDVRIPEGTDVVGLSNQVTMRELVGGDGDDLLEQWRRGGELVFGGPRVYSPPYLPRERMRDVSRTIITTINGVDYVPSMLRTIRGAGHVLRATRRVTRELVDPMEGSVIELTPSLAIRLVELEKKEGQLRVRFGYDAARPATFFDPNSGVPFIESVRVEDETGAVAPGHAGMADEANARLGVFAGEGRMTFPLAEEHRAVKLHFDVVLEVVEEEVEFVARDVGMPIEAE